MVSRRYFKLFDRTIWYSRIVTQYLNIVRDVVGRRLSPSVH